MSNPSESHDAANVDENRTYRRLFSRLYWPESTFLSILLFPFLWLWNKIHVQSIISQWKKKDDNLPHPIEYASNKLKSNRAVSILCWLWPDKYVSSLANVLDVETSLPDPFDSKSASPSTSNQTTRKIVLKRFFSKKPDVLTTSPRDLALYIEAASYHRKLKLDLLLQLALGTKITGPKAEWSNKELNLSIDYLKDGYDRFTSLIVLIKDRKGADCQFPALAQGETSELLTHVLRYSSHYGLRLLGEMYGLGFLSSEKFSSTDMDNLVACLCYHAATSPDDIRNEYLPYYVKDFVYSSREVAESFMTSLSKIPKRQFDRFFDDTHTKLGLDIVYTYWVITNHQFALSSDLQYDFASFYRDNFDQSFSFYVDKRRIQMLINFSYDAGMGLKPNNPMKKYMTEFLLKIYSENKEAFIDALIEMIKIRPEPFVRGARLFVSFPFNLSNQDFLSRYAHDQGLPFDLDKFKALLNRLCFTEMENFVISTLYLLKAGKSNFEDIYEKLIKERSQSRFFDSSHSTTFSPSPASSSSFDASAYVRAKDLLIEQVSGGPKAPRYLDQSALRLLGLNSSTETISHRDIKNAFNGIMRANKAIFNTVAPRP